MKKGEYFISIISFFLLLGIGIAGIFYITEKAWLRVAVGAGGIGIAITLFYFYVMNIPYVQKIV